MKAVLYLGLAMAIGTVVACGKSPEQQQAEALQKAGAEMQKNADQMQKGATDMAKGFEAMARGLGAAVGGTGDQKPVEPVDFHVLQGLMPEVSGWEKGKPKGERMTMPVPFASAEANFTKGNSSVEVKITDSGFNQLLMAPLAFMLSAGYSKETDDGYEKATRIGGNPGLEKWDTSAKRGELTAVVKNRFIVEVDGRRVSDPKELRAFMDKIDLKALADLK